MANNSAIVNNGGQQGPQQVPGHFQQPNSAHHCKECGLFFDSAKSLEVHLQYHKENLLNKWATQAAAHQDQETNNNTPAGSKGAHIKREFPPVTAPADSSDSKQQGASTRSPDSYPGSRATPESAPVSFGHPPTPQSYHSAPSPYEGQPQPGGHYSPGHFSATSYQQQAKSERSSPQGYGSYMTQHGLYQPADQQYFAGPQQALEQLAYPQDYPLHKMPASTAGQYRYHPYGGGGYERSPQVSSSSPAYGGHAGQPTPSPSPKQCDKCGCVCDSAAQLIDHLNHAHPPTPAGQQHFTFPPGAAQDIKQELKQGAGGEDEPQTEILDLDSHKVHHVFQSPEEEEELKRNGELQHSVNAMLGHAGAWQGSSQQAQRQAGAGTPQGIFGLPPPEHKQMYEQQYLAGNAVSTSGGQDMHQQVPVHHYRPFPSGEHQPNAQPVISSTQLPPPPMNGASGPPPVGTGKGANWKSNEARRPKTYNCSACNKWFTSSGHLKRHYNTTLHKNAVKSSGQPDPATMPISAHHHPGREERSSPRGGGGGLQACPPDSSNHSPDSGEDLGRSQDDLSPAAAYERAAGLLQPPSGPYDRHLGPGPPIHSPGPSPHNINPPASFANLSSGSPPNGEAGPSALHQEHLSRGLLSISTVNNSSTQQQQLTREQAFNLFPANTLHMMSAATNMHSPPGLPDTSSPSPHQGMLPSQQQQAAVGFHHHQQMSPHSMPNYPNVSAPHVMPAMVTNSQPVTTSLTITGDVLQQYAESPGPEQFQQYLQVLQYQQQEELQPLPSFAQFQHHRYGLLLAPSSGYPLQANVGGSGPATDPLLTSSYVGGEPNTALTGLYVPQVPAPSPHDDSYEITVLETAELSYSPPQGIASSTLSESPPSPAQVIIKSEPKSDYEHGSPQITSTGSPAGTKTTSGSNSGTTSTGLHKCFDCDKVFNKACYLTQHNKTFHCGDKPFKCHRCGKRFPSEPSYQEHLAKHAGDKPYKCELCPKQFNHKTDLRRHMCLHTGQKPYACAHCGKGFIRKDHMLKHAETHSRKSQAGHAANSKNHHQVQYHPQQATSS